MHKKNISFQSQFRTSINNFSEKNKKNRNKNGTCSFMWPLSKMLPYRIDKLPFLQFAKKPLDAILAKNSHKKGDGKKKPYCIYPANDLKLQK